ncbi:MAG: nicotinate-nucleotide--dimethylbenzimidazole phosphoribosyltransferase [Stackebrandtia sp.]
MNDDNAVFADAKVPFPDAAYATRTTNRLVEALIPGTGIGSLTPAVAWSGRVQGTEAPRPFTDIAALIVSGTHEGDFAYGDDHSDDTILTRLAERAGVSTRRLETVAASPAETGPALTEDQYLECLETGKQAADACIDAGADLLVLCGLGQGTRTAAIAVTSHLTRTPAVELSPRLRLPGGVIDDNIWMRRTAAIRDAFTRLSGPGRKAKTMLTELGGPVLATLTGVIVAAAIRRTPMLIDGPVAAASALVARDFSLGAPKWCYAPDRIPHPVVDKAAGQIGMADPIGFGLDIGEGCAVLNAVPLMQDTLRLVDEFPFPAEEPDEDESETP